MTPSKGKVLLAMSGGVDSSVAAALLLREGYEVVGVFMRLGSPGEQLGVVEATCDLRAQSVSGGPPPAGAQGPDRPVAHAPGSQATPPSKPLRIGKQGCCSINDAADARLVAAHLDIPFYVVNFKKDFGRIIDYFTAEYAAGRTPNPCVRCNDWLKFGRLHDYAKQLGCDSVASGHYARIEHATQSRGLQPARSADASDSAKTAGAEAPGSEPAPHAPSLLRGVDHTKDQSYVLFGITPDHLDNTLLPIGGYTKKEIRALAQDLGLPVFDKPDSQEICFVPDQDYAGLVERRKPELATQGNIVNTEGETVGQHEGHHRFTIGQRRGVGVALGYPIYVVDKDPTTNTITIGGDEDLLTTACTASEANWLGGERRRDGETKRRSEEKSPGAEESEHPASSSLGLSVSSCPVLAQYRYNSTAVPATLTLLADSTEDTPSGRQGRFHITFDEPQRAVAPGQAIVLYDQANPDRVLGGGWIEATERPASASRATEDATERAR